MIISRPLKISLAILGLAALFAAGLILRRVVLDARYALHGQVLPFNMESALEFRYVRMLFAGQGLPVVDRKIQVPEGINVRQTYTIGAEYVYAWAAKALPSSLPLSERVRWIAAGWFCLGIPLLSLWLWWWLRSAWAAGIGGAYYAVSLAAVMRSTGQELSHENFALPMLIGYFALGALAEKQIRDRAFAILALLSAAFLAGALASWDLVQFVVLWWAMFHYVRLADGAYFAAPRRCFQWGATLLALLAAGLLNPYLRAHGLLASPAMMLAYGTAAGIALQWARPAWKGWRRMAAVLLLGLAPLLLAGLLAGTYGAAYGHFWELIRAKIMFLNQKPADPALLTFAQRILWAPALNSATWRLTGMLFPVTLPLLFLTVVIICSRARWRSDPEIVRLLWFGGLSLPAFILFVRFHVFLIVAVAALLGWAAFWASSPAAERELPASRSPLRRLGLLFARGAMLLLLLAGVGVEAAHVLREPWRWGSDPVYPVQKQELVQWLRENGVREPVLANFGLSAFVLTYADCPIVLHPKFESAAIRRRVQTYGEALFTADESGFRDWAEQFGAVWYVYALGEFADPQPELQMRYCVNALRPPADAAARRFEFQPDRARYFQWLWGNSKYRVFRIIRRADERRAERIAREAQAELARGDLAAAEAKATLALLHDPHAAGAQQVLLRVGGLRDKGIR